MSKFYIVTDSTCDLPSDLANQENVIVLPLKVTLNDQEYSNYLDHRELDPKFFYSELKNGKVATTAQINPDEYLSTLTPLLDEKNDILILAFSSELSGTYNSARIAVSELKEKYKNQEIQLIDTKSASLGEGFLVHLAIKERDKGKSISEVSNYIKEMIPKIAHWFTVDDIGQLIRGGRVSKTAGFIAKIANIKPILHTSNEGKLIPKAKVIGRKRAISALFNEMKKTALPGKQTVFIGHGDDLLSAEKLADLVKQEFDVENLYINMIGPVVGAHTGQGVLALFFIAKNR